MLQSFRTAAGEPAFTYNGRLLCSKFAPQKEAMSFVEKHERELAQAVTVFVLGLAGGHVVNALHQKFPHLKIVVIEADEAIIEGVSRCFTFSLMNAEILHFKNAGDLKSHSRVRAALRERYVILRHPVTSWLHSHFYAETEDLLVGRTPEAFTFILQVREDVKEVLRPLVDIDGLASIKTLSQNLSPAVQGERVKTKLMIKALRELVV